MFLFFTNPVCVLRQLDGKTENPNHTVRPVHPTNRTSRTFAFHMNLVYVTHIRGVPCPAELTR